MKRDLLSVVRSINRPTLGEDVPLLVFRAFRVFSGEYLKEVVGEKGSMVLFQNAGRELGKSLGVSMNHENLSAFLSDIGDFMKDSKIGLLIVDRMDGKEGVLRIEECITCSGMQPVGARICHFEAGFVAGVLESFFGKRVKATETKCNAMGEGVCEITVEVRDA
ncbi:MAG TPA: 4-vinyl reductase [Aquificaceae bacterium]|nr:4-vinyl reductase [Aquificaceae bacterium]HIQ30916.1 4-vinyl reductase [Aquifex aeolicus]